MNIISSGEAYVRYAHEGIWIFGNSCFENTVAYDEKEGLRHVKVRDTANSSVFMPGSKSGLFSVRINLKKYDGRNFKLNNWTVTEISQGEVLLDFHLLCNEIPLEIKLSFRIVNGAPAWQQRLTLKTESEGFCIHGLSPLEYKFDMECIQAIAYYMKGCKHQGCTPADLADIPYEDFRLEAAELGRVFIKSGRRATEDYLPYLFTNSTRDKTGLFMGVQWSGHWFLDACNDRDASETRKSISVSAGPDEFMHILEPGREFFSPRCYIGLYKGDISDAAHAHKKFLETAVIPGKPYEELPVTYNTWYAMDTGISESLLMREADVAAKLGVEYFIIDAGWYGGSKHEYSSNCNFSTGLGDWKEDRLKFPSGIASFSDYVHSKGMKFGLWVEPERVDLRTFTEGGWKKEWLAGNEKGEIYELKWDPHHSGWLCFGIPEVREWVKTWLSELVEKYGIDWIKWDSNWWTICRNPAHGHQEHDGEYFHVLGVYEVFEFLLKKHPHLTIESCAGGGTRMDTGMMQYAHLHWIDDETELPQRVRCHCSRLSYYMPQDSIYTFALPVSESLLDYEEYRAGDMEAFINRLDSELKSRMMGILGLGYKLGKLPEEVLAVIGKNIEIYKSVRNIVREGSFYHLLPALTLKRPEIKAMENEAYIFVLPDKSKAVLFVFINDQEKIEPLKLTGLDKSRAYKVIELTGVHEGIRIGEVMPEVSFIPELKGNTSSAVYLLQAK